MFNRLLLAGLLVLPVLAMLVLRSLRPRPAAVDPVSLLPAESSIALVLAGPRSWEQLRPLLQRESPLQPVVDWLQQDWQLDLERDVMPWAGRMGFAVDLSNSFVPLVTGVIAIRDERRAAETMTRLRQSFENRGGQFREFDFEGIRITASVGPAPLGPRQMLQMGFGFAQTQGCIIVGNTEPAVRAALQVLKRKGRKPLVETDHWQRLQAQLPAQASLTLAADLWSIMDCYAPLMPMAFAGADGLPPSPAELRQRINQWQTLGWAGIALEEQEAVTRFTVAGVWRKQDPNPPETTNALDLTALRFVPASALACVTLTGLQGPAPVLETLVTAHVTTASVVEKLKAAQLWSSLRGCTMVLAPPGGPDDWLVVARVEPGRSWTEKLKQSKLEGAQIGPHLILASRADLIAQARSAAESPGGFAHRMEPSEHALALATLDCRHLAESIAPGGKLMGLMPAPTAVNLLRQVKTIGARVTATSGGFRGEVELGGRLAAVSDLLTQAGVLQLLERTVAPPPEAPELAPRGVPARRPRIPVGALPSGALPPERAVIPSGPGAAAGPPPGGPGGVVR